MRAHAKLGPSSAERWIECPGSVRLIEQADLPEGHGGSSYAAEGTMAHELAEIVASNVLGLISVSEYKQQLLHWRDTTPDEFHDEMMEHATAYANLLASLAEEIEGCGFSLEQRVATGVPGCWGTADAVLYSSSQIHIVDFKYGAGVPVQAENNPQIMLYAVGALEMFDVLGDIQTICMTIHQPRVPGGLSHSCMEASDLRRWRDDVVAPQAQLALSDEAYLSPSSKGCRWCPVAGECKTRAEYLTRRDFGNPDLISPQEMGQYLAEVGDIESWCRALRETALNKAYRDGVDIPGWKVVLSGGRRTITDHQAAIEALDLEGYEATETSRVTTRPLGELERLVGGKEALGDILGGLVGKTSGRASMVPEDDPRPGTSSLEQAQQDFAE